MTKIGPQIIIFDLDNTLTESRMPLDEEMSSLLCELLHRTRVAMISGGTFFEFKSRVVDLLPCDERLRKLYLLPTTGSELFVYEADDWQKKYTYPFSVLKRQLVVKELSKATGIEESKLMTLIEDRGTQLTYSALGAFAPIEEKKAYDPERKKRSELVKILLPKLPDINITMGGRTSIDFTEAGVDKAFGVQKLFDYLKLTSKDAIFIGDALSPGGNDSAVKSLGIKTIATIGPEDTKKIIRFLMTQ